MQQIEAKQNCSSRKQHCEIMWRHIKIILLLKLLVFHKTVCICKESYMTLCDTIEDFENYNNTQNINEVVIGSETNSSKLVSVNFMETLKLDKYQLSSLIIINSINNLEMTYHYECLYVTSSLKYFSLYKNNLGRIERYHFPLMPVKKFSLINNKIESIEDGAFRHQSMEELDLSDNYIETIKFKSLPETRVTKILTIRNNKLSHIPPKHLPVSLISLDLERNNLRYLQEEVLSNLKELQKLILSRNKFTEIPKDVATLKSLVIFDISYNEIQFVDKWTFKEADNLKLIDLSHNKISSQYILNWLDVPNKQPQLTILLALNRLKDLHFGNVHLQNKTFIMYGNPWNCSRWTDLKKTLAGHESKCDLEFLADEGHPYCIPYSQGVYNFSGMWEHNIDQFHEIVKKNQKISECSLAIKKHQLLYPVDFFCATVKDEK